jgi:hypothetical protein
LTASGHCIPSGHRKLYTPGLPRAAVHLVNQRDVLHSSDPQDPEVSNLNKEINNVICESSRIAWAEKIKLCGPRANPTKFWVLLQSLSGKSTRQPPNQPITFGTRTLSKPQSIAKRFDKQFTSVGAHRQIPETRRVIRQLRHKLQLVPDFNPFNNVLTLDAIKLASNSTATGPDGLTTLHLKHPWPTWCLFSH